VTDSQGQWSDPGISPDVAPADAGPDARRGTDGGPEPGEPAAPSAQPSGQPSAAPSAPPGLVSGDVMGRVIAIVIDGILIGIVSGILQVIAGLVFGPAIPLAQDGANAVDVNYLTVLVGAVIGIGVSFAYFSILWTKQRATLGMRVLALQVGNDADGATITLNQAAIRWAALLGPWAISQALWPVPGLGSLLVLASSAWAIALLVTTAMSPTKQGMHDRYAHTMVVKLIARVA
jgi:uncharacterized RDD family membrane protein YckC